MKTKEKKTEKINQSAFAELCIEECKAMLLQMTPGTPRPRSNTRLGKILTAITTDNLPYTTLAELCVEECKAMLLRMAREGKPRPEGNTRLGRILSALTTN